MCIQPAHIAFSNARRRIIGLLRLRCSIGGDLATSGESDDCAGIVYFTNGRMSVPEIRHP